MQMAMKVTAYGCRHTRLHVQLAVKNIRIPYLSQHLRTIKFPIVPWILYGYKF